MDAHPPETDAPLAGLRVGIIGASMAGLSAVVNLRALGASVSIFERSQSVEGRGYFFAAEPAVLDDLLAKCGRDRKKEAKGDAMYFPLQLFVSRDRGQSVVAAADLFHFCHYSKLRAAMVETLSESGSRSSLYLGHKMTNLELLDNGCVKVFFESQPPASFDLVVGADGYRSTARRVAFTSRSFHTPGTVSLIPASAPAAAAAAPRERAAAASTVPAATAPEAAEVSSASSPAKAGSTTDPLFVPAVIMIGAAAYGAGIAPASSSEGKGSSAKPASAAAAVLERFIASDADKLRAKAAEWKDKIEPRTAGYIVFRSQISAQEVPRSVREMFATLHAREGVSKGLILLTDRPMMWATGEDAGGGVFVFGAYKPSVPVSEWSVDKTGACLQSLPHGALHERSVREMEAAITKEFAQLRWLIELARVCVPQLNIQVISEYWPTRMAFPPGLALLGDAAHVARPHVARGSVSALIDGRALAQCLAAAAAPATAQKPGPCAAESKDGEPAAAKYASSTEAAIEPEPQKPPKQHRVDLPRALALFEEQRLPVSRQMVELSVALGLQIMGM